MERKVKMMKIGPALLFIWIFAGIMEEAMGAISLNASARCLDDHTGSWQLICAVSGANLFEQTSVAWKNTVGDPNSLNTFFWDIQKNTNTTILENGRLQKVSYPRNSLVLQLSNLRQEDKVQWKCTMREKGFGNELSAITRVPDLCLETITQTQPEVTTHPRPTTADAVPITLTFSKELAVGLIAVICIVLAIVVPCAIVWYWRRQNENRQRRSPELQCSFHNGHYSCYGGDSRDYLRDVESIKTVPSIYSGKLSTRGDDLHCCSHGCHDAKRKGSYASISTRRTNEFVLDSTSRNPVISAASSSIHAPAKIRSPPVFPAHQSLDVSAANQLDPELLMALVEHNVKMSRGDKKDKSDDPDRKRTSSF